MVKEATAVNRIVSALYKFRYYLRKRTTPKKFPHFTAQGGFLGRGDLQGRLYFNGHW